MRLLVTAVALTLLACSADIRGPSGETSDDPAADGPAMLDAGDPGPASDAGDPGATADADPVGGPHVIARSCNGATPGLRIAVSEAYEPTALCYPQAQLDGIIVLIADESTVAAGGTVLLSPAAGGNFAYFCPANAMCETITQGEIDFTSFTLGVEATGVINIASGAHKLPFEASWCDGLPPC